MLQSEAHLKCNSEHELHRSEGLRAQCPAYKNNHVAIAHFAPESRQGQLPSQEALTMRAKVAAEDFARYRDVCCVS